jgi:hypothetical protein
VSEENEFAKRVWDDIPVLKLGALIVWFLFMNIGIHKVFPELEPVYIMVFTEIVFSLCVYEFAMSPIKRHFFMKKGNGFSYGQVTVASFTALVIFGLTVLGVLLMRAFGVTLDGNTVRATYDWSPKGVTSILLIVLVAPVYEEILFKYVIQHCVFRNTVGWIQILATGILFGFSHGTTYHAVFGVLFGIITSFVFVAEQDLVICILIHIFYNIMVTFPVVIPVVVVLFGIGVGRLLVIYTKARRRAKRENKKLEEVLLEMKREEIIKELEKELNESE